MTGISTPEDSNRMQQPSIGELQVESLHPLSRNRRKSLGTFIAPIGVTE